VNNDKGLNHGRDVSHCYVMYKGMLLFLSSNIQPHPTSSQHKSHPTPTNLPLQDAPSILHDKLPTTRHQALQGTPFNNSTFAFVVLPAKTRPLANRRVPHCSTKPRHGMRFIPPLPLRKQRRFLRRHRHGQCMRRRRIRAHDLRRWAQVLRDDPRQRLWNHFRQLLVARKVPATGCDWRFQLLDQG
jgi:hypothetical protein